MRIRLPAVMTCLQHQRAGARHVHEELEETTEDTSLA